jgi:hypothetical protein
MMLRKTKQINDVCLFLLNTIRLTQKGSLNWSGAAKNTLFFRTWDEQTYQDVKKRIPNRSLPAQDKTETKEEDQAWRRANRDF